jgi:ribosomal protein S27AE
MLKARRRRKGLDDDGGDGEEGGDEHGEDDEEGDSDDNEEDEVDARLREMELAELVAKQKQKQAAAEAAAEAAARAAARGGKQPPTISSSSSSMDTSCAKCGGSRLFLVKEDARWACPTCGYCEDWTDAPLDLKVEEEKQPQSSGGDSR